MFISVLDLFKIGIGPSSSHTIGPMVAAKDFLDRAREFVSAQQHADGLYFRCILKGSLAYTGKGHSTDRAVTLGLHGYSAKRLAGKDVNALVNRIRGSRSIAVNNTHTIMFSPQENIIFDQGAPLPEHPNGMIFELVGQAEEVLLSETYFSIGGGFISTLSEINTVLAPLKMEPSASYPYPFDSANSMMQMSRSELDILISWAANEGWNPGLHDADIFWNTDPEGYIAAEIDGELIGGGSIVSYRGEFGFMGFFIVKPEYRGHGLGTKLWFARREKLQSRLNSPACIGMDGVFEMQPFYTKG